MRILVTGANGFVGKSLCLSLLTKSYFIRRAVRTATNDPELNNISELCCVGEIGPETGWRDALKNIDVVVHLAARVHVIHDVSTDPLSAFRQVNVAGTERLTRQAAAAGVRRLIYISSIKVNGEESPVAYTEKSTSIPQDAYAISKWEAEQKLHQVAAETGLEVVIIRPPLVYGPGVKANFLQLLNFVKRGIPLPLAEVENRRSLIFVENLVDAIIACVDRPEAAGQTYLVSDGDDISTAELIRRISHALGRPDRLFPFPPGIMRMAGRLLGQSAAMDRLLGTLTVEVSKIRNDLNWTPPYTMEQGLAETADWFMQRNHVHEKDI